MKSRRYGQWAGHPEGWPEDTSRCIASVRGMTDPVARQCSKSRMAGPDFAYCTQHAKRLAAGKRVNVPGAE